MALEIEIRAYEARREELERECLGKYAVFHGEELLGIYDNLDKAAQEAIAKYGRGPYLIRQVGERPDPMGAAHLAHLSARPAGAER